MAGTLAKFQLIEQFCASGKNAILIVPEGPRNASDSFGGKLEDTNGFALFMAEAMGKLERGLQPASMSIDQTTVKRPEGRAPEIGSIILSGHSGGYHVMAAILDHGGLSAKNQGGVDVRRALRWHRKFRRMAENGKWTTTGHLHRSRRHKRRIRKVDGVLPNQRRQFFCRRRNE
ncbi:MAG: hypothetical protein WDN00_17365 [Limisphaerales bacterium]